MPKARSLAHRRSPGTSLSKSVFKSSLQPWLGKQSTEVRTCSRMYKQPSIFLSPTPPEGLKQAIEGRIQALSLVHSLFIQARWIGAELSAIANQELAPYSVTDGNRVRIAGPQILLEPTSAQAVAVCLHELATNAAKYCALSA